MDDNKVPNAPTETPKEKTESIADKVDETPAASAGATASSAEPAVTPTSAASEGKIKKFWHGYLAHKKRNIPLTILAIIVLLLVIPFTRYAILGLFMKQESTIVIQDSKTGDPVSKADIALAGVAAQSDESGKATIKAKVGNGTLSITKKYYADSSQKVLVSLTKSKNNFVVKLTATGRVVPVTVTNKINGQPVANATVQVSGTEAKTDKDGTANIALPADKTSLDGALTANGYNSAKVTVKVTDQKDTGNNFTMTPAGKIYFLSKASGKIDVVKTNLDGTARQTVLAGTGKEEDTNTVLLASRDWKYLALKSRRDSTLPKLYLISTADDKVTTMDEGDASFDMVGWQNSNFVYIVNRNKVNVWQPKASSLKSYNAAAGKITVLDNTNAKGTDQYDAEFESFNVAYTVLFDGQIVYAKSWYSNNYYSSVPGQKNTLNSINPDGSNKKVISSLDASTASFNNVLQYEPDELLIEQGNNEGGNSSYYTYDTSGNYKKDSSISADTVAQGYPTYLLSPSGNLVFWYEERDGKNSLFTSKTDKSGQVTIGSLTEYKTYGWYSDSYLLVSKKDSELYILANAPIKNTQPLKISDYHRPNYSFYGYGGGYGGPN